MPRRKTKGDVPADERHEPSQGPFFEIHDCCETYDAADRDLSPDEQVLHDALGEIELIAAQCICNRKTLHATSKSARNRKLRELERLMQGIREDGDRLSQIDLATTAGIFDRFARLLRLSLDQPGEVIVNASLMASRIGKAKTEDMRVARNLEIPITQQVIKEVAARWRPDPDRPQRKRQHKINPTSMAGYILEEVRRALAVHPEVKSIRRKKGKPAKPISQQRVRHWLVEFGFPTAEQRDVWDKFFS